MVANTLTFCDKEKKFNGKWLRTLQLFVTRKKGLFKMVANALAFHHKEKKVYLKWLQTL